MLYRYLLGAMRQVEITMTVRAMCTDEEVGRLPGVVEQWRRASARMQELANTDPLHPQVLEEPPRELQPALAAIEADQLFRASFAAVPSRCQIIEVDHLIAPQRDVNLDYVSALRQRLTGRELGDLVEFCLAPRAAPPPIRVMQTAQNHVTFSSPSLDLRFLGGFPKTLTEDDIRVAYTGGQPAHAIALLIGFGAAPINVWAAGNRLVLNNGFHRIVALRSEGITRIPVVVQHAANPGIEFPDQLLGLSKAYLLQDPRPLLVKDFFDAELILEVQLKPRMKTVKVAWGPEDGIVPIE